MIMGDAKPARPKLLTIAAIFGIVFILAPKHGFLAARRKAAAALRAGTGEGSVA